MVQRRAMRLAQEEAEDGGEETDPREWRREPLSCGGTEREGMPSWVSGSALEGRQGMGTDAWTGLRVSKVREVSGRSPGSGALRLSRDQETWAPLWAPASSPAAWGLRNCPGPGVFGIQKLKQSVKRII